jgi:hypothetical protein
VVSRTSTTVVTASRPCRYTTGTGKCCSAGRSGEGGALLPPAGHHRWAVFSPFATLLLRSYLLTLPRELEDAARLDGAGELQVLRRVVLPLAWPGFLTVALVTGLGRAATRRTARGR